MSGPLLPVDELRARLGETTLRVLDASWYLATMGRNAHAEFRAGHIPGAQYFDLDEASDPTASLPHMLPPPGHFAAYVETLGISSGDTVVIYDGSAANLSAARAWWMFRAMGHADVFVLDGGWGAWVRAGGPVESGDGTVPRPGRFAPRPGAMPLAELDDVRAARSAGVQVVDMRSAGRFEGRDPEPRPGLRGGHVPGSRNLPYATLVDERGLVRKPQEIRALLAARGIDERKPIIATCGSGVSACALILSLEALGAPRPLLYDGSWSEWAQRSDTEVTAGAE